MVRLESLSRDAIWSLVIPAATSSDTSISRRLSDGAGDLSPGALQIIRLEQDPTAQVVNQHGVAFSLFGERQAACKVRTRALEVALVRLEHGEVEVRTLQQDRVSKALGNRHLLS